MIAPKSLAIIPSWRPGRGADLRVLAVALALAAGSAGCVSLGVPRGSGQPGLGGDAADSEFLGSSPRAANPGPTAEPSASPSAAPSTGLARGRVTTADGAAAAGARVRFFPQAGKDATAFQETVTDDQGAYAVPMSAGATVNIEVVAGENLKAFKSSIAFGDRGAELGTLVVGPTGGISGRVALPVANQEYDLLGVDVFVPGSSYVAKSSRNGGYLLEGVAAGVFDVVAAKPGLGSGQILGVTVTGGVVQSVPDLVLELRPPKISALTPANGGPGTEVEIRGADFGAATQDPFRVTFNGSAAVGARRLGDGTIEASVPDGATSGNALVTVGDIDSNAKLFRVIRWLRPSSSDLEILLGQAATLSVSATDDRGAPVPDPAVRWTAAGGIFAEPMPAHELRFTATRVGTASVAVNSGSVATSSAIVVYRVTGVKLVQNAMVLGSLPATGDPDPEIQTAVQLIASVEASDRVDRKVRWTSTDPAIATVTQTGLVSATSTPVGGTVTITATSRDDASFFATASVTVEAVGYGEFVVY